MVKAGVMATVMALALPACSKGSGDSPETVSLGPRPVESGMPDDPKPVRGGELVYGLEAETADYCLSSAQVAIAGMQVMRAIYDPLTVPNAKGGYSPYLARSLEHDPSYKVWTIRLRANIKFHDGSPLNATVVKNNLDAYRGKYKARESLLFMFALDNIDTVTATDELTVKVTTKVPWVAFPAHLFNSGRIGIMAQAQLDATKADCETHPIGTGPFSFVSWDKGVSLKVKRNPNYWQPAPDGKPYPYLNGIDFRPEGNSDARLSGLLQGDFSMIHTSTNTDVFVNLPKLRDAGDINLLVSEEQTETTYNMFNASEAPFDRLDARLAAIHALDQDQINKETNAGTATLANGPFAPGVMGYLADTGLPGHDPEAAKAEVKKLKADGVSLNVTLVSSIDPTVVRQSVVTQRMLEDVGFTVKLEIEAQDDLITRVINKDYQLATFRNQPGDDPDMNHVWWYGDGNPVNFGGFDDKELNKLFDQGRSEPDQAKRKKIYEAINRRMASQVYNAWGWWVAWAVAEAPNVHGILGPPLPDRSPAPGRLVTGHPVLGIWIDGSGAPTTK